MKVVVFYTNDLIDIPTKHFLHSTNESDSEEAIRCVDGLAYCRNTRKKIICPTFIALYNMLMNGVGCVD